MKQKRNELGITAKYRALQGAFYAFFCMAFGYNTYYLGVAGFKDGVIGTLVSLACFLGGIIQAEGGKLADSNPRLNWRTQTIALMTAELVISLLLLVFRSNMPASGALFFLMMMLGMAAVPMVNTAPFYYSERGVPVDFGIARGIGSAVFGIVSFATGALTIRMGDGVVPAISAVSAGLSVILALSLPLPEDDVIAKEGPDVLSDMKEDLGKTADRKAAAARQNEANGWKEFFSAYPELFRVTAGIFLILILHNIVNTYLIRIVESVGGSSADMGIALGIAALMELPALFFYAKLVSASGISSGSFITIGGAFYVVRGLLYLVAGSVFVIYLVQLLQSVSFGLLIAAKANYANEVVDVSDQAKGQSLMAISDSLGTVGGSLVGGLLIDLAGLNVMLLAGVACAAVGTFLTYAGRKERTAAS